MEEAFDIIGIQLQAKHPVSAGLHGKQAVTPVITLSVKIVHKLRFSSLVSGTGLLVSSIRVLFSADV